MKAHYLTIISVLVILYILYKFKEMFAEKKELNEINATGADYAPVAYDMVKFQNFNISELRCKDGTEVPPVFTGNAFRLLANLQVLRNHLGKPIFINSGFRTRTHNEKVRGAVNSAHLRAQAADIIVIGMAASDVRAEIEALIKAGLMQDGGIGRYNSFTHYDVSTPRRWKG